MTTDYAIKMATAAKAASRELLTVSGEAKSVWLTKVAQALRARCDEVVFANLKDVERAEDAQLSSSMVDRLTLTKERIDAIADAVEEIRGLNDPVGEVIEGSVRPNGLRVSRVRVPLGVVFFIYESRPNVTIDAAALCVKSGNAVILRGGKEAAHTNKVLHALLVDCLSESGLPAGAVQFVDRPERELVGSFLAQASLIDVAIPRGGRGLIERVSADATMPVIRHFDGICHVYVDEFADLAKAEDIVMNSKCQRPGVCNAAESLLIHTAVAKDLLPSLSSRLLNAGVELRGCEKCCQMVQKFSPASQQDYATEYLDLVLSVRVVDSFEQAVDHIQKFGSGHTEAIVTENVSFARRFTTVVDASAVVVNASTRFNDGGELGLGAEIGISTDKFHARGPCGLRELTSYKYIVEGSGQTR
ncbi:MAG: glutamate-5-semialdehyde dehydrogenase [Planctomycetaceae bacterium]